MEEELDYKRDLDEARKAKDSDEGNSNSEIIPKNSVGKETSASQENHENNLNQARAFSKIKNATKKLREKKETAKNALNLASYIDPFTDWLFGIGLALAILKDIMDFTGLGSLPIVGWMITFMVSTCIFFILLLAGAGKKSSNVKALVKKYGTLIGGTSVEMIFGIGFLPIETLIIIITFILTLKERQEEATNRQSKMEMA